MSLRPDDCADADGLIQRQALKDAGARPGTISSWIARGALTEVLAGIYRRPAGELPWRTMCRAAAIWGGEQCALSHHTAAALHGLECFLQEAPIHLSAMDRRKPLVAPSFEIIVHTPRTLKEEEVTLVNELRVTSVGRTLLDLAATMSPMGLEYALGDALRAGLISPARLKELREVGRKRKGHVAYTNVIELKGETLVRTDSRLEDQFMKVFVDAGLELLPQPRFWIGKWDMRYRADFAFPKFNLAIETDSWKYHGNLKAWTKDVIKNNHLVSWGWSVLRFTELSLKDPGGMAQQIREALVSRGW